MPNTYVDLGTFQREYVNNQAYDEGDATEVVRVIESASRTIDGYTRRHFYVTTLTRYLDARDAWVCEIDDDAHPDLLSVGSVAVDTGYNRAYSQALTLNVDYELASLDSDDDSAPPYNALRLIVGGAIGVWPFSNAFYRRMIRVTNGVWGYSNDAEAVLTSAGAAVTGTLSDATDTTLATSAIASPEIAPGMTLRIGSEDVYVISGSASPFVVKRGVNGTTPAAHAAVAISKVVYPPVIVAATALWAARLWERRKTPIWPHMFVNAPGISPDRFAQGLDPDIEEIIAASGLKRARGF